MMKIVVLFSLSTFQQLHHNSWAELFTPLLIKTCVISQTFVFVCAESSQTLQFASTYQEVYKDGETVKDSGMEVKQTL